MTHTTKTKRFHDMSILIRFGLVTVIFLATACVCIGFIFAPVKIITTEEIIAYPAISVQGLMDRAAAWIKYPEYNIGLGIAAALSFGGAVLSAANMYYLLNKEES